MASIDASYAQVAIEAAPGTDNWVAARRGCLGASQMADVLAVSKKDGKPLEARTRLMRELVSERMTDIATAHFVTPAMQWGLDHEDRAVAKYEERTGNIALKAGWIKHPQIEFFGATPDRILNVDGLLEVKCPTTPTFIKWLRDSVVPEEYRPQMLAQLACTGRAWCDFVAYDPRIVYGSKIFIRRFEPEQAQIDQIEIAAKLFLQEVDALFTAVVENA